MRACLEKEERRKQKYSNNDRFTNMEEILINNKLSLPPNVNGRCRGQFQLCLHEPKWHNKDAISFDGIQIKIVWWGENYYSAGVLKYEYISVLFPSFSKISIAIQFSNCAISF